MSRVAGVARAERSNSDTAPTPRHWTADRNATIYQETEGWTASWDWESVKPGRQCPVDIKVENLTSMFFYHQEANPIEWRPLAGVTRI